MAKVISWSFLTLLFAMTSAMAEGFYAGAGIGVTQIADKQDGLSYQDNPVGWRMLAGYDFNEYVAIEGSYANSGEAKDDIFGENVATELTGFTVSVVGLLRAS